MYFYWAKYPQPLYFSYSPIIMEDEFYMISMYRKNNQTKFKDLIEMFNYPIGLWAAIIVSLLLFICTLVVGRWFLEKKKGIVEPIWIVSMFTLDQDYLNESNSFLYLLSTCLSFACFFITTYLLNNMRTDLVVIQDPIVLGSYQDVIDKPDAMPLFLNGWPDYEEFKYAPRNSVPSNLWKHAEKVQKIRNGESQFRNLNLSLFMMRDQLLDQKVTLILSKVIARVVTRMTAQTMEEANERILLSKDETRGGKTVAFLGAPGTDRDFYKRMSIGCTRLTEHGFIMKMIDMVIDRAVEPTPSLMEKIGWTVQKVQMDNPEEKIKIKLDNVHLTFRLLAYLSAISIIALLVEVIFGKYQRFKRDRSELFIRVRKAPSNKIKDPQGIQAIPSERIEGSKMSAIENNESYSGPEKID